MSEPICEFDKLLNKNVPHIIEKIFYNLDCESFNRCRKVAKVWRNMLMSEGYHDRLKEWQEGEDMLISASMEGNLNEVTRLLSIGVSPNCERYICSYFTTPLAAAAIKRHRLVVELLLDHGANPNKQNSQFAPLIAASIRGHQDIAKLLLGAGADPNMADSHGRTPLHFASGDGSYMMVKLLLDSGADPDKTDAAGVTALENAIDRGHKNVVGMLIVAGARPDARVEERIQEMNTSRIQEMNNSWISCCTIF